VDKKKKRRSCLFEEVEKIFSSRSLTEEKIQHKYFHVFDEGKSETTTSWGVFTGDVFGGEDLNGGQCLVLKLEDE
jgi:hypothetical protein